jgi:hypothetical protein
MEGVPNLANGVAIGESLLSYFYYDEELRESEILMFPQT